MCNFISRILIDSLAIKNPCLRLKKNVIKVVSIDLITAIKVKPCENYNVIKLLCT